MVCLTKLPVQENLCVLQRFYNRKDPANITPHVTKLLVDDCIIHINSIVLSLCTNIFSQLRDENDEIFMEGFLGQSEQVQDCLDLLHGHHVQISFSNIQVSFIVLNCYFKISFNFPLKMFINFVLIYFFIS